jgi:hypothetical protein
MSSTATLLTPTPTRPPSRSTGQIAAGAVLAILAAIAFTLGGLAMWGDSKTDSAGYLSTKSDPFITSSHAIATDDLEIDGTGWLVDHSVLGDVRLRADSRNGKPVFVGIARTDDVDAYLRQTSYAELTDIDTSPFKATYRDHAGGRVSGAPADQGIWAASTHGAGTQTLNWKVQDGKWSVVVMNADGSRGVDASVSAAAKIDWLDTVGWALIGGGVLLAAGGAALIVSGSRRRL